MDTPNNTPEPTTLGKTEDTWVQIAHEFQIEIVRLCKENSLTYIQLNYVLAWILGWAAEYVYTPPETENSNDDVPTS